MLEINNTQHLSSHTKISKGFFRLRIKIPLCICLYHPIRGDYHNTVGFNVHTILHLICSAYSNLLPAINTTNWLFDILKWMALVRCASKKSAF